MFSIGSAFTFEITYPDVVMKIIINVSIGKRCQMYEIPTKVVNMNKVIFANFITDHFNYCITCDEFPYELKRPGVISVHKNNAKCDKANYRLVSILTHFSNIYEKFVYNQLSKCFDNLLLTSQCGFRKGFSSQCCLLVKLGKFRKVIDRGYKSGALLTDISKAFSCIDHKHLFTKLYC